MNESPTQEHFHAMWGRGDVPGPWSYPHLLPRPSLPGSVKNVLLLVFLGIQDHDHTAGKREENVPKIRGGLRFRDDSVPNRRELTHRQGSLGAEDSLSGHLFLQVFMLRILETNTSSVTALPCLG